VILRTLLLTLLLLSLSGCISSTDERIKKEYYTGGKVRSEFIMNDESGRNGIQKHYGYEGEILYQSTIENGLKNGIETWYDQQGNKVQEIPYLNGKKEGVATQYFMNGKVTISYEKGVRQGAAAKYDKSGKVIEEVWYENGRLLQ